MSSSVITDLTAGPGAPLGSARRLFVANLRISCVLIVAGGLFVWLSRLGMLVHFQDCFLHVIRFPEFSVFGASFMV